MRTIRTLAVVLGVAVLAITFAAAKPEGKGKQGNAWKKGQGWDKFAAAFDADKDGKVSKAELLAKRPAFDLLDTDKDGTVTEAEIDARPAAQKNPNIKSFLAKFDENSDRKVTAAEWDAKRTKAFETADKNHDGMIDSTEATGELMKGGGGEA